MSQNLRTPLSRVLLFGSAREGANSFIVQRLSAIALVPLLLWFVAEIIFFIIWADYASLVTWMRSPFNSELLIILIILIFYHANAGLHEVIVDYIHNQIIKVMTTVFIKFAIIAIAVASVLAVLRIALGN
jgi:succinate dehydrogenase / fumarate reductase membrane anchor subunit